MIKIILAGLWVCAVTLGSSYGAMTYLGPAAPAAEKEEFFGGLESVKTEMISIPVIADGVIAGYVIAQFAFTIDADLMQRLSVKPDMFVTDAAFRTIYEDTKTGAGEIEKPEFGALANKILERVNKRFGKRFVRDVLVHQYKFVSKNDKRGGMARPLKRQGPDKSGH